MLILAIDPGISTGIATKINLAYNTFTTKQNSDVYEIVYEYPWDYVVIEQYSTTLIGKYGLRTVELVGAVEGLCYIQKLRLIKRNPIQRTPFVPRAKTLMKELELGVGLLDEVVNHQVSALSHLLGFERALNDGRYPTMHTPLVSNNSSNR